MAATPMFTPNGFKTTLTAEAHVKVLLAADITAAAVTVTVSAADAAKLPASGNYFIQIDNEQMQVTAGQGTTSLTVTRAVNGTQAAPHFTGHFSAVSSTYITAFLNTITVADNSKFPQGGGFNFTVGSETMTVTAGWSTNVWTVTRGVAGPVVPHPLGGEVSASASLTGGQVVIAPTNAAAIPVPCPPGSSGFFISCATQDARVSLDGTVATATNGMRVVAGSGEPIWMPFASDLSVIGMAVGASDVSIVWAK